MNETPLFFRRYDVTAALVACPPASMEVDERRSSDRQGSEEGSSHSGGGGGGGKDGEGDEETAACADTPNAKLLDALSR